MSSIYFLKKFILIFVLILSGCNVKAESSFTLPSGVSVTIVEKKFDPQMHKITGCTTRDNFCNINGEIPFGIDQNIPKTILESITINFQDNIYVLDTSNMYDAWGTRPLKIVNSIRYFGGNCYDLKNCQFRGLFSDAAGSFVAEWLIREGKQMRTVLTNSKDVLALFQKNIDPPLFE